MKDHLFDFSLVQDAVDVLDKETLRFVRENDVIRYKFDEPDDFFKINFSATSGMAHGSSTSYAGALTSNRQTLFQRE